MIKRLSTIFIFVLLIVLSSQNPVVGVNNIVWSDDFNDGDLDGWRAEGYYAPLVGPWSYSTTGEMANIDNVLRLSGELKFRNGTYAIHESSVAYGSWSFDLDVKSIFGASNHTHVYFIDNRLYDDSHAFDSNFCCYDIMASSSQWDDAPAYTKEVYDLSPAIFLVKRPGVQIMGYFQFDNIDGWSHIDVTRDEEGNFKVYINGTLRIEATDNTYEISNSFWLTGETGTFAGLDNIVIRDYIIDPTLSTTTQSSTNLSVSTSSDLTTTSDNPVPLKPIFFSILSLTLTMKRRRLVFR